MNHRQSIAFAYLRLSREEALYGESASIENQRMIIESYCQKNDINLIRVFYDDGYTGVNFKRPGFQEMLQNIESGKANTVITKDLSRLGRDMGESSYYAEQYFPEHGIHYFTIAGDFDTRRDNVLAPFQFAMNEVYVRDGSRKVKEVLKTKREKGLYCACPPFGYKKDPNDNNKLIPDEVTAPIVQRIFERAANGDSSWKIAHDLTEDTIITPLKYRVLYRDKFSDEGASRAVDVWNNTTVKRILKNPVYLGHTVLGKVRKYSFKSEKKVSVPQRDWAYTQNTHEPLVSQSLFDRAQSNLAKGTRDFNEHDHVRQSIFSGLVKCERCGHSLCSAGTVYKGEREKYWYLTCTHQRDGYATRCEGVRIRYTDLLEVVRTELNSLIALSDDEIGKLVAEIIERDFGLESLAARKTQLDKSNARVKTIDRIIAKLYFDNAEGRLSDERMQSMVSELEREAEELQQVIDNLSEADPALIAKENYDRFFALIKDFTNIETVTRSILLTLIDRIVIGPKRDPNNSDAIPKPNQPFIQSIRIFYKFIGELKCPAIEASAS